MSAAAADLATGLWPSVTSAAANAMAPTTSLSNRMASLDWSVIAGELDASGAAVIPALLSAAQCAELASSYARAQAFRSRVVMAKHGFGRGEYQYFRYPLPALVEQLRISLYAALAPIANRWSAAANYPATLAAFLERCHAAGQTRPTPLLLRYGAGDYNCLHQDLYGEQVFPLQATVLLSKPGEQFDGGECVLTEQRPRMQSRVEVVPLGRGDAVVFAVHHRPVAGSRGTHRVNMRHGVSRIRRGERYTLGIVLHDAT
jgi:uncharacterized protein